MVRIRARGRGAILMNIQRIRAEKRAAHNLRIAEKLQKLRMKRLRTTGKLHLTQKVAAERALIRAAKAKTQAIRAAKFRVFAGKARQLVQKAKKAKRTFQGFSF